MKKTLSALVLAGAMALGGCVVKAPFQPVERVERVQDNYRGILTRADTNGDQKYDKISFSVRDEAQDKVLFTLDFIDRDYDGTLDIAAGDIIDQNENPGADGVYDGIMDFVTYFKETTRTVPKPADLTVDSFYKRLLDDFQ